MIKEIELKGKIEFNEEENKCYDRTFVARLGKSGAFQYGNQTCVAINWGLSKDGIKYQDVLLDTRYEMEIEKDFKKWLIQWFKDNYCEHVLTIY